MPQPHIVTLGGGTGHYTLLTGLRTLDARITAIVTMMDSGGSSGRLRDEYGLLPPGDFTRCLIALSSHPTAMKELLGHRFGRGSLEGHTVRNLIFAAQVLCRFVAQTGQFKCLTDLTGHVERLGSHSPPRFPLEICARHFRLGTIKP